MTALSIEMFTEYADAYGGDLSRWPDEARADAQALLQSSPAARDALAEAAALDAELALDIAPQPSDALMARILSDAAAVGAERPASAPKATPRREGWFMRLLGQGLAPAGMLAASLALGIYTGSSVAPETVTAPDQTIALAFLADPMDESADDALFGDTLFEDGDFL